ncbi:DNAJ heat shock N-terminal domain-containing protein [Euphorbia peplus]|nr:DNAJ heat shock N-terminal domain-containing protein [Euphorbia peplus]
MECNKEEAVRAREIAEGKMQNGDFQGARRIATKAQRLYPDLDNIAQLLLVCDVHCSAENKLNGSEMDWYGILQIDRCSDESAVKKQFRKFALSLHPDKNKFSGAEGAFKLIGEANRVLTDPVKRSLYDMKCGGSSRPTKPKPDQSNQNVINKKQNDGAEKIYNASGHMSPHPYPQPQQPIFWTRCPTCNIWYQYHRQYKKNVLSCQTCRMPFIALDMGVPPQADFGKFVNEKRVPNKDGSRSVASRYAGMPSANPTSKAGRAADTAGTSQSKEVKMATASTTIGRDSEPQVKVNGHVSPGSMPGVIKTEGSKNADGANNKRRRKSVEKSSGSLDKGNSGGSEGDVRTKKNCSNLSAQKSKLSDGHQSKRPSRQKPPTSHKKKLDAGDDDFVVPPPKRSKSSPIVTDKGMEEASGSGRLSERDPSSGFVTILSNGDNKEVKQRASSSQDNRPLSRKSETTDNKPKVEEAVISEKVGTDLENSDENSKIGTNKLNSNEAPKTDICVYPDPDFNNFEKQREESNFAVNQVWAIYDSLDSMPRFYARIRKVITPGFKLQITWLEWSSKDKAERRWSDSGLPVACGRFENGNRETVDDNLMFSHVTSCVNVGRGGSYFVCPKKGEIWAVYKNWDLEWSAEPAKHGPPYEFDFVEILTDFTENVGIGVSYLEKVKGFISIFQRDGSGEVLSFTIRPNELYKFSHQIPSFKLTGKEREGVPVGSYELDTAALPSNLCNLADSNEISVPKNLESGAKVGTRSPKTSTAPHKDNNDASAGQQAKKEDCDNVGSHGKPTPTQPESKKLEKNKFTVETSTPRRSPRDLSKSRSHISASRLTAEDINDCTAASKDNDHMRPDSSSCQQEDKMDLHAKGISLGNSQKGRKSSGSIVVQVEEYDFEKEKSEDKFQVNQIWALHSDEDGLPRKYGQVRKIDASSGFTVHVAMLENVLGKRTTPSATCGIFKVKDSELVVFPLSAFSHQVKARGISKDAFEIWPKKGEIWAMNKIDELTCDIVEIVEDNNKSVKVVGLKNQNSEAFVLRRVARSVSLEIKRVDFLERFSHQCLAFHLGDLDSRLKMCWQLDPSSVHGSIVLVD